MASEQPKPQRSEELRAVTARWLEANDRDDVAAELARLSDGSGSRGPIKQPVHRQNRHWEAGDGKESSRMAARSSVFTCALAELGA
jgi:hypothetical protein